MARDYKKENELVDYLIYLDQNPQEAKKYFLEPIFLNDELPASVEPKHLLAFFEKIVSTDIVPVSTVKWKRGIHLLKLRKKKFLKSIFYLC